MRKENIYKSETSNQEFISKAFMRTKLYTRLNVHSVYVAELMDSYLSNDLNREDFRLFLDEFHLCTRGYVKLLFECSVISADEQKNLMDILRDLYIDVRLCRYNDECRAGISELFAFLI